MNTPSTSVSNAKIDTDESPHSAPVEKRGKRRGRAEKPSEAERDEFYWEALRAHHLLPPPAKNTLQIIRLVRHAYALGWRDRVEVEKALRDRSLVPLHDGDADAAPYPEIEDFLTRLIADAY